MMCLIRDQSGKFYNDAWEGFPERSHIPKLLNLQFIVLQNHPIELFIAKWVKIRMGRYFGLMEKDVMPSP